MRELRDILGNDWVITSAGGQTGEAYIARSGKQQLFLKRNSSPFLAVLSAEGIVPRLLWTKRLENGDVITAQRWMQSRELKANEMNGEAVAGLLGKIHRSEALLAMLKKLGKKRYTPDLILADIERKKTKAQAPLDEIDEALSFLKGSVRDMPWVPMVVCHCDIHHNNWLLDSSNHLYLVDWDNAVVADPALDLGMLLYGYINKNQWRTWLQHYGIELDENLMFRMYWYALAQILLFLLWHRERNEPAKEREMYESLRYLHRQSSYR